MWVNLDDEFFDHPKNRAAGKDGRELLIAALCHTCKWFTGGVIADHDLPVIAAKADVGRPAAVAWKLVDLGRWHRENHDCPKCGPCPPGHYLIHDYGDFQRDAGTELQRRAALAEKRSIAGKKGAAARWQSSSEPMATAMANGCEGPSDARQTDGNGHGSEMAQSPVPLDLSSRPGTHVGGARPPDDDPFAAEATRRTAAAVAAGTVRGDPSQYRAKVQANLHAEGWAPPATPCSIPDAVSVVAAHRVPDGQTAAPPAELTRAHRHAHGLPRTPGDAA